jgi:diacylglycerol kinase (ATP)
MAKGKVIRDIFRFRGFNASLKLALKGIAYLFLFHRNMRIIFLLGIAAFIMGLLFKLKGIELVALCVTITLVFMAEIFNTAIEMMIDILTEQYHVKVKLLKDIAAAVVVLTCLNAVAVGYILFIRKLFLGYFSINL